MIFFIFLQELRLSELGHNVCDTINCEKIFQVQDGHFLSRVEVLYLKGIYKLQGPIQVASLQYLRELKMSKCNRLKSLLFYACSKFAASELFAYKVLWRVGRNHWNGPNFIASSSQDHLQPISFPSLERIWIYGCSNLKSLFPISVTRSLSNLKSIRILGASKLEQVFGYQGELNVEDDQKGIVFPELKELELSELPSLKSFVPMGYHFRFPTFISLNVEGCPNLLKVSARIQKTLCMP